ncbi:MAG: hypothetical protein KGJ66_10500 [Alphaproteobacteria bacterium]|nr:hypothetical protein [Alphaproteobacteria bacterium]
MTRDRKALLLRVGIDRGTGGALAPIFANGTFEYVPIPEECGTNSTDTYATLRARDGGSVARFLPARLAGLHPHIDPDFRAMTYGDAAPRKRTQLNRLCPGDLLVFYAGLTPVPPVDTPRLFVVGYLEVKNVHRLTASDVRFNRDLRSRFGATAHFARRVRDRALTLVEGSRNRSRLLAQALPLGDGRQGLLADLAAFGYRGSLVRAVGHWVQGAAAVTALEAWLESGPAGLVGEQTRLLRVAPSAIRVARNPRDRGDLVVVDRRIRVGDWILSEQSSPAPGIVALARISRVVEGSKGRRGLSPLCWHFSDAATIVSPAGSHFSSMAECRAPIHDAAAIRKIVSWMATHYRMGVHAGNGLGRTFAKARGPTQ